MDQSINTIICTRPNTPYACSIFCKIPTKEIVPYPLIIRLAQKLLDAHAKPINVR